MRNAPTTAPNRGGALITALVFVAVIGISLASYLTVSQTAVHTAHRALYLTATVDLAETGLEHGMWSINAQEDGNPNAWTGWTINGSNATRTLSGFDYGAGVTGTVKVLVENYAASAPAVCARARITLANGATLEKWLRVTTASRGLFAFGLLARDTIVMSGGAWVDSWQSDPDNDPATPPVGWSPGVARDNGSLASASTALPSISIGSADLYGTTAVGSSLMAGLAMSWGGQVGPRGMPIAGPYNLAPGALTTNFTANFETVTVPSGATPRSPYVLPRSVAGPPYYLAAETIGSPGATTYLQLDSMSVAGAATLTIEGDVTLYLPPSGITTLNVAGSGRIRLAPDASLTIYTPGNITVSGAGITNPSAPANLQIWSNRNGSLGQTIRLAGSGALNAAIYAPDADLILPGHTDFAGAAVVNSATLSGSGSYHFDESLKNFGSGGSVAIDNYSELNTAASRSPYIARLSL
ncbi:DUF7305 domain-containing protein [Actomonas aquatica]|uniref:DUF7305 domain-containing protein n=1 Tax=Actomonas aquatica TaxID=2866162 RepID=A0ABZ1C5Z5_9BACT|nr:hypothetical protein [Opitutus sp. WL0086]WRQ86780.1 hypothetical protein K1X11_018360 [Opitutus sp. WL0086]